MYGEVLDAPGAATPGLLETYSARGWCRLEVLAALAPKKFSTGAWRPGPRSVRFRYHHDPRDAGVGPCITSRLLRDPLTGRFTVDADRAAVRPVLLELARRYAEYAASGSDAWDQTLDVHDRPLWLKRLAGVAPGVCESPAASRGNAGRSARPLRTNWSSKRRLDVPPDDDDDDDAPPTTPLARPSSQRHVFFERDDPASPLPALRSLATSTPRRDVDVDVVVVARDDDPDDGGDNDDPPGILCAGGFLE